ncbi:hypothetical protein HZH66_003870 [Vespula vulgaris]|uniref:Uncharacterized protein n=1 Tax=Vespula vulgaris TaxID=7454 RepID=A0A836UVU8_VESVU|nr:hypothetical protein HZH66_003870 [Vespula vulgaris]
MEGEVNERERGGIGYAGYGFDKHLPGASSSSARLRAHGGQECLLAERLSIALGGSIGRREEDEDKEKEEKQRRQERKTKAEGTVTLLNAFKKLIDTSSNFCLTLYEETPKLCSADDRESVAKRLGKETRRITAEV